MDFSRDLTITAYGFYFFALFFLHGIFLNSNLNAQESQFSTTEEVNDGFFDDFDELQTSEDLTNQSLIDKHIKGRLDFGFSVTHSRLGRHAMPRLALARSNKIEVSPVPEGEKWESMAKGNSWLLRLNYQATKRISFDASIPFVFMKFVGDPEDAHLPHSDVDSADLLIQYTFGDGSLRMNYGILHYPKHPFSLNASIGYGFPLADYVYLGHSAIGTQIKTLPISLSAGRLLSLTTPILDRIYLSTGYTLTLKEKVLERRLHEGAYNIAASYAMTDIINFGISWNYSYIYGLGIWDTLEWGVYGPDGWLPEKYIGASTKEIQAFAEQIEVQHDRLLASDSAILSYQLTLTFPNLPKIDIVYLHAIAPYTQLMMYNRSLVFGTRWNF